MVSLIAFKMQILYICLLLLYLYSVRKPYMGELNFASPQFGQATIPGTDNLKCVRRFLFAVLEVLLNGTAIMAPPYRSFYSSV